MTTSGKSLRIFFAAVLLAAGAQVLAPMNAFAAPKDGDIEDPACSGSAQGQVSGGCAAAGSGGHGASGADADADWDVIRNSGTYCQYFPTDSTGPTDFIDSYIGDIQNNRTGEIVRDHCVAQVRGNNTNSLKGQVKKSLKAPTPNPDFKADFLVGAPITFSAASLKNYTLPVPNFPDQIITITATDVKWDFGDGKSSTDLEPVHVYESISPNKQNADQHKVKVTLDASWQVNLLNSTTGTSQDLGIFTDQGELDRSIVQVWSKQTEPIS